jgi:hypothetical protein
MRSVPDHASGSLRRLSGQVTRGMRVRFRERDYVVAGFDPMSVHDPNAYLEDLETGESCEAPFDELFGPGEPQGA